MTAPLVALDLGGVIVEVDRMAAARQLGMPWLAVESAFFGGGWHDAVTVGTVSGLAFVEHAAAHLRRSAFDARAAWAAVVEVWPEGRRLVDDLLARGVRVHLWSNTDPIHLEKIAAGLPGAVGIETASFRLGAAKPDAAFFTRALAHGIPQLFLDDREDLVAAALAAGVRAETCVGPAAARRALERAGLL